MASSGEMARPTCSGLVLTEWVAVHFLAANAECCNLQVAALSTIVLYNTILMVCIVKGTLALVR